MDFNEATKAALGEFSQLSFTASQARELEGAQAADPVAFEKLVEYARNANNPAASIILGSRNIAVRRGETEVAKQQGEADKADKRVRSALSYSRSALGLIPRDEQEQVLRDEFPWMSDSLVAECLSIGARANDRQMDDEASLVKGASMPIPKPAHNWPMPRSAYAARFWGDPKHWIPDAGARWCDLPDDHPMKHPLDMEV